MYSCSVYDIDPPILSTLNTQPSWTNRQGRIDRSACAELTVRDARQLAQRNGVDNTTSPTPARARITITAHALHALHNTRNPFVLQGDHRTPKANAMKTNMHTERACDNSCGAPSRPLPRKRSARGRLGEGASMSDVSSALHFNPNAGACRHKLLGLPAGDHMHPQWSQQITLICPTSAQLRRAQRNGHDHPVPTANHFFVECPRCSSRVRKLFIPLCTEAEANDAMLAQLWLQTHDYTIRPHMKELYAWRNATIERYSILFTPRCLACRKCLQLRYGETRASRGLLTPREQAPMAH